MAFPVNQPQQSGIDLRTAVRLASAESDGDRRLIRGLMMVGIKHF
jgi:hypothetical protein